MEKHPNYSDLYEPWTNNIEKLYNHKQELEYQRNSNYQLLYSIGLKFAKPIENSKIERVDKKEMKQLLKTGTMQLEDLKVA